MKRLTIVDGGLLIHPELHLFLSLSAILPCDVFQEPEVEDGAFKSPIINSDGVNHDSMDFDHTLSIGGIWGQFC